MSESATARHAALLRKVESGSYGLDDVARIISALARVVKWHSPEPHTDMQGGTYYCCFQCLDMDGDLESWPCNEMWMIAETIGIDLGEY